MLPVVCFIGSSGAGKTTLIEALIAKLKARGYRIAVIKHAAHGFDIDWKGKDSWRFTQAGADIVAVASPDRSCWIQRKAEEPSLEEMVAALEADVDLVLVEGYKRSPWPKILVGSSATPYHLVHLRGLLAVVGDEAHAFDLPHFSFKEIPALADFIMKQTAQDALFPEIEKAGVR